MEHHFKFTFKIEPREGGGFTATSDSHPDIIEGGTREEVEAKLREKLTPLIGAEMAAKIQLMTTDMSPADAKKAFDIVVKRNVFVTKGSAPAASLPAAGSAPPATSQSTQALFSTSSSSGPIERTPDSTSSSKVMFFIVLIVGGIILAWFLSHR